MTAGVAIRTRRLTRRYGYFRALDGVDLELERGRILLLLGANGAGKTTLLRILAGLLPATEGEWEVAPSRGADTEEDRRGRVGFLSHALALYPDLTARENLRFFAGLYGMPERGRIDALLGEMNLSAWADEPVRNYSRGMKQRLALGRALLHDPEILLLDEPFTGLDRESAARLVDTLVCRRGAGKTIVIASHRTEITGPLGDRAALLEKGRLVAAVDLAPVPPGERGDRLASLLEGGE